MKRRFVVIAVVAVWMLWFAGVWAQLGPLQQTGIGVAPNQTPAPTPTPPPGTPMATNTPMQAQINAAPAGTAFSLACGTYRYVSTGDTAALNPLTGDSFVGAGLPSPVPTAAPTAEPCVELKDRW
jgi:hypothetical protein